MPTVFDIIRYYLEDDIPREERTTYVHAGHFIEADGERFAIADDPRATPLGPSILTVAKAIECEPNLWFAIVHIDSACPTREALVEHGNVIPPGHWYWNPVEEGPVRRGIVFLQKGEYDELCRQMAERSAIMAKERVDALRGEQ